MNTETTLTLKEQVESVLGNIRMQLQSHGGDVELVDVDDQGVVSVRLVGACQGCPGAVMTLRLGIERILRQVPGVTGVEAV